MLKHYGFKKGPLLANTMILKKSLRGSKDMMLMIKIAKKLYVIKILYLYSD